MQNLSKRRQWTPWLSQEGPAALGDGTPQCATPGGVANLQGVVIKITKDRSRQNQVAQSALKVRVPAGGLGPAQQQRFTNRW